MNRKYTSREVQKLLNITRYELDKLKESDSIQYEKVGGRFQFELNEELKKSFLPEPQNIDSLSTSTGEDNVEKTFNNKELEFPEYNTYNNQSRKKKELALTKISERDNLIELYRTIADKPEVEGAIDEIINEMLSNFKEGNIVKLDFTDSKEVGEKTKTAIQESFAKILQLLNFNHEGDELVKDWYRDGFVPLEVIYDNKKVKDGIQNIVQMMPFNFRKLKDNGTNETFYAYVENINSQENISKSSLKSTTEIYKEEQIVVGNSGKLDSTKTYWASFLRPALKPINNLSSIEDSLVIYRLTKASEKNIWNIDVGSMPGQNAKQHLSLVSEDIKSNVKYNTETGMTNNDVAVGTQSDWIFPTRNGKQKTTVETIEGNADFISKLEDLNYFRRKVNESLKIPVGRLEQESSLDFSTEDILREELKFTLFVNKLRRRFTSSTFIPLLYRDLISSKKITEDEWRKIKQYIIFKWNESNAIVAKAEANNTKSKLEAVAEVEDSGLIGKYISMQYVYKNILQMSKEEFEEQKKIIEKEKEAGLHDTKEEEA